MGLPNQAMDGNFTLSQNTLNGFINQAIKSWPDTLLPSIGDVKLSYRALFEGVGIKVLQPRFKYRALLCRRSSSSKPHVAKSQLHRCRTPKRVSDFARKHDKPEVRGLHSLTSNTGWNPISIHKWGTASTNYTEEPSKVPTLPRVCGINNEFPPPIRRETGVQNKAMKSISPGGVTEIIDEEWSNEKLSEVVQYVESTNAGISASICNLFVRRKLAVLT